MGRASLKMLQANSATVYLAFLHLHLEINTEISQVIWIETTQYHASIATYYLTCRKKEVLFLYTTPPAYNAIHVNAIFVSFRLSFGQISPAK
jgi:hypothetical protein